MQELKPEAAQFQGSIMYVMYSIILGNQLVTTTSIKEKKKGKPPSKICSSQKSAEALLSQTKETEFIKRDRFC